MSHAPVGSFLLLLLGAMPAYSQSLGVELLTNGGAETGDTTGWSVATAEVVTTAFVDAGSPPAAEDTGDFSFHGGANSPVELVQTVDVTGLAGEIDAGTAAAQFHVLLQSRRLGGLLDVVNGTLTFLSSTDAALFTSAFEDPSILSGTYEWDPVDVFLMLPVGTRSIELAIDFERLNGGISTDAFADNASLVVVPEPDFSAGLVAIGALAAAGSSRSHRRTRLRSTGYPTRSHSSP